MADPIFKKPLHLDAYALRAVAERASSVRGPGGNPYFLVDDGDTLTLTHIPPNTSAPTRTVIVVDTLTRQPHRPPVTYASITSGKHSFRLDETYDSVFWSEAAVEKFVFPYLVSRTLWKAANHLKVLSDSWYHGFRVRNASGAEEVVIPFAIGHTPDSDFNVVEGKDLDFLYLGEDGTVHARSLAELIAEREAADPGTAGPAPRTPASPDGA